MLRPISSSLPLAYDESHRFLPLLVALMVFLAAMAVAGALIVHGLIGRWDRDVTGTLTIQVPPPAEAADAASSLRERLHAVERVLADTPGIASAQVLGRDQLVGLIEPWLGSGDLVSDLPLPGLIDVAVAPGGQIDITDLARRLAEAAPGTTVDDHQTWLQRLVDLGRAVEAAVLVALATVAAVTAATVIYATRTGMAVHRRAIELLRLIGAEDAYIARQFADRAFALALRGGLIGLLVSVPALLLVDWAARRVGSGFIIDLSVPAHGWPLIVALPLLAALLARFTAQAAVHRATGRLP